ncbi:lamin tail domain-containing protein [Mariniradius sediminis]|uniref:Lamin tail domain-containing protein n=1 Tax=Mariniradius sediminis TaxID=2909237 RepID=A0ABS9BXX6_9BACT|nr:lamin tail domain-containing protein [Mariniradius sediminis]MCF1752046.1 lamin tail domain-containing protein [Mariniradius sediminis]
MKTERFFIFIPMVLSAKITIVPVILAWVMLGFVPKVAAQVQGFEDAFEIVSHPEEFLPFWSANEVRSTSSRIFQAPGKGRNDSKALAIQPLSTFEGQVFFRIENLDFQNPKLAFFARTESNGTGNRPALLFLSFAREGETVFTNNIQIGNSETFPNKNTAFQLFEIPIPEPFKNLRNFTIRWSISVGPGTGSAARVFLDDIGLWESDAVVDPIKFLQTKPLNPFWVELGADREMDEIGLNQIRLNGNPPFSVIQPNDTLIWIESSEPLPASPIDIELYEVKEKSGAITPEVLISIPNDVIRLGRIAPISPEVLLVQFSHPYTQPSVSQTAKFLINGKNPKDVELLADGFSIKLRLSEELVPGKSFILECREITSALSGGTAPILRETAFFVDGISEVQAIDPKSILISLKEPVRTEDVGKEKFGFQDSPEIAFKLEFPDHKTILLRTEFELEEEKEYLLQIPPMTTVRGFTLPGIWKTVVWDKSPPELTYVVPVQTNKLMLVFSENLDPAFALNKDAYRIGTDTPSSVELQPKPNQVLTAWKQSFLEGSDYLLEISGIFDLQGNQNNLQKFPFTYEKPNPIGFKSIVINEVMPAPRAGNSLPNAEYVEIINTGESRIFLGGMQLANSRRQSQIPSISLDSGELLILCSRTHVPLLSRYGMVLGLSNWPSFLNSGDNIRLISAEGEVLDSLKYTTASFGGSTFAGGGYSLEIVNPYLECFLPTNLKASQAPERGTPGKQNSVFDPSPDLTPLRFIESLVINDSLVVFRFNKNLQPTISKVDVEITPRIDIRKISLGSEPNELFLELSPGILKNTIYRLAVKNLRACTGNALEDDSQIVFVKPSKGETGDLVINEVLFNPRTGAPKFVEIYNTSEKYINLRDWKLANLDGDGMVANRRVVFDTDYLLAPKSYLVFTTDIEQLKAEYPKGIESQFVALNLPSYPVQAGNVVWMNPDESIQEIFSYDESMHHRLLKEKKGVSLERSSPWIPASDPNNWKSASAFEGFATPGYRNSTNYEMNSGVGITVEPKVFSPDAIGGERYTTIGYSLDQAGFIGTIAIYSAGGTLIKEICQNAILGNSGIYTWDGTDQTGRRVRAGYYVVWIELYDLNGNIQQIKKTVAVGTNF